MQKPAPSRVGEIDLFRFIFSVIIVLRHAQGLTGENLLFPGGAFAVEFFFLVSGYLMMASIEKRGETGNLAMETTDFLKRKVIAIYPEVILAYAIGFCVQCVFRSLPWEKVGQLFMKSSFEALLLQRTGLGDNAVNSPIWYVQSMLLCMVILYPMIRKYPEMMRRIVMPLTALLLLGYLLRNYGSLRNPSKWIGFTYKGNLRAMAELCLGAECYFVAQYLRRFSLTPLARSLITMVKWFCWLLMIGYMLNSEAKWDSFMLAVFCIPVVLAFSGQGLDVHLYQNKLVAFLGRFSLPLFLSHMPYANHLSAIMPEGIRYRYVLLCYILCAFATASLVMVLGGVVRRKMPCAKAKMRKWFLMKI